MQLLLRRNYLVLEVEHSSDEHVLVETLAGEKFHERWCGFAVSKPSQRPLLIPCNGWRTSQNHNWTYLDKGEYIAGSPTSRGIIAMLSGNRPLIVER
jgi:hypothetical protein